MPMLVKIQRTTMIKTLTRVAALGGIALLASPFALRPSFAQDHSQMHHEQDAKPVKKKPKAQSKKPAHDVKPMSAENMPGMDHGNINDGKVSGMDHGGHEMKGFLGPYGMGREGSGTSWQPDTSPHQGIHAQYGEWMTMWHAMFNGVYDNQGGPRGDTKAFVSGMVMAMAQRQVEASTFGFRAMMSPEPFMGANGYPNLLATGETADGRTHLVDRQHPHELFMELAATYSYQFAKTSSVYLYAGLPGEPALGPSAFMHRTSGLDNPEAPITHHWLDSTHIVFGVLTAGVVLDTVKLEASTFRGREPDQYRYDIEAPKLDSYSARASWNPTKELSMQVSWGHIESPEQLVPMLNENRITASIAYTKQFGDGNLWATTLAWGRKYNSPGNVLDGYLAESELIFKNGITLFGRAERVQNDELLERGEIVTGFESSHPVYTVSKISAGGIYDFIRTQNMKFGIGALASRYGIPDALKSEYGDPTSYMIFARLKIQ
jgi:hypothetical protein